MHSTMPHPGQPTAISWKDHQAMMRLQRAQRCRIDDPQPSGPDAWPRLRAQHLDLSLDVITADLLILRPGKQFEISLPQTDEEIDELFKRGHFNLHYPIVFDDGVRWMLRVRRDYNTPGFTASPPENYWPGVEREAVTLQVMNVQGIKTVPNGYLPPSRLAVTPSYPTAHLYCDFMPGSHIGRLPSPMSQGIFDADTFQSVPPFVGRWVDVEQARRFISSYADHQIAISNLSFDAVGQLVRDQSNKVMVGPFLQYAIQVPGKPWQLGPYHRLQDLLFAVWEKQIEALRKTGRLHIQTYLSYLEKKRLLSSYGIISSNQELFIKHLDESADQYFVQNGQLTAVLDWEWAYTTIKEQAFMAPKGLLPTNGADLQLSEELDPLTDLEKLLVEAYEQKDRPDLADCVRAGPMYRLIDVDHIIDFRTIESVRRFRRVFGRGEQNLTYPDTMNDWVAECLEIFKDDPGLEMFSEEDRAPQPEVVRKVQKITPEMMASLREYMGRPTGSGAPARS